MHRRLGVRNVLLQQQASGLVAKLIGFGPLAEDMDNPSDKAGAGVSPDLLTYCVLNVSDVAVAQRLALLAKRSSCHPCAARESSV